jgi:uncharacterized protein
MRGASPPSDATWTAGEEARELEGMPSYAGALAGLVIGVGIGYATRRGRLCTFGAIEDACMSGDLRRLKALALALAVALAGTQLLIVSGVLDPAQTVYVPAALPWVGLIVGGLLFGLGMALVGTCGFGTLVRLGGGDLRSLVVLLVLGATAFAALRGTLAELRGGLVAWAAVPLPMLEQGDRPALPRSAATGAGDSHGPAALGTG